MKEFIINENDAGQRADRFIQKAVPGLPGGKMYKFLREKKIKLNGKRCEISTRLQPGDVLKMYIPDEFFASPDPGDLSDIPADVDIVYEDENILVANKPSGLVVHEDSENSRDTLINRVTKLLHERGEYDPISEQSFAPALCNRIDRNTEGLVICAKTAVGLREVNEAIRQRLIKKTYLCVTVGIPREREGIIKTYLEKSAADNTVYVRAEKSLGSKTAVTKYKTLATAGDLALCEVDLLTGRTHQIRAHMAYIGCPLIGDGKYGRNEPNRRYKVFSQALCSYKLTFDFPAGSKLSYLNGKTVTAPTPAFAARFFPDFFSK